MAELTLRKKNGVLYCYPTCPMGKGPEINPWRWIKEKNKWVMTFNAEQADEQKRQDALDVLFSAIASVSVLFDDFTDYPSVMKWRKDTEKETYEKYAIYAALLLWKDKSDNTTSGGFSWYLLDKEKKGSFSAKIGITISDIMRRYSKEDMFTIDLTSAARELYHLMDSHTKYREIQKEIENISGDKESLIREYADFIYGRVYMYLKKHHHVTVYECMERRPDFIAKATKE